MQVYRVALPAKTLGHFLPKHSVAPKGDAIWARMLKTGTQITQVIFRNEHSSKSSLPNEHCSNSTHQSSDTTGTFCDGVGESSFRNKSIPFRLVQLVKATTG